MRPRGIATAGPRRAGAAADLLQTRWATEGKQGAASLLGLNPSTLRERMRKLGIRKTG